MNEIPTTPQPKDDGYQAEVQPAPQTDASFWQRLVRLGLDERLIRIGSVIFTALLLLGVVLIMGRFYASASGSATAAELLSVATAEESSALMQAPAFEVSDSTTTISRQVSLHTILPALPRTEIVSYTIQPGDTLFSIAEKFGLKPESILWGNRYTLGDDPHMIYAGQQLLILPVDALCTAGAPARA